MTVNVVNVSTIDWSISNVLISTDGTKTIVLSTGRHDQDTFEAIRLGAHGEKHLVLDRDDFDKSQFVIYPYYVSLSN